MSAKGWVRCPGGGLECVSELCVVRSHDCTVDWNGGKQNKSVDLGC